VEHHAAARGTRWRSAAWLVVGAALPASSAAVLVAIRGTVPNTDIGLLILAAVLVVAVSGRRWAAAVAAVSAAVSFDYFHTMPYHSLTIANRNDAVATLVLGVLALGVGQIAVGASESHIELVMVVGAAVLSQAVPEPARILVDHRALDVSLFVLVFATALTIAPSAFRGLASSGTRIAAAIISAAAVLPALSWAASRLVSTLALRRGVLAVGLAPAEVASVATTSLAGGEAAVAAGILVGSTVVAVLAAGIGIHLLGGGGSATVGVLPLLTNLGVVVALPLGVGIAIRYRVSLSDRQVAAAEGVSVAVVTLLVWLIASQVRLSSAYIAVAAALLIFLVGSAALGAALGVNTDAPVATAILLTTSMRDFAIAAGIAVAAFGAASAAPLGLYGAMVITWGMATATLRPARRQARDCS
jgi:predicted Na+-dependent transporter